ncbi:MAG: TetR/AcrR family transcriptional regulator [Bacteroidales bacterium]|nr:TetR/AcrR family transcriptional regulator [Bacteroidales bacterium]
MTKPFENTAKYRAIFDTARELFWKHGVRRVSVEEICRNAGVSKMTFYKMFPNKVELAKHIYDRIVDVAMEKFRALMFMNISVDEKIRKMIELKIEGTHNISQEFIQDLYKNPDLGLKVHVEETSRKTWSMIAECFREAQRKGVFRSDIRPEFLLYYTEKMAEMITDERLIRICGSPEEAIKELIGFFAYGISEHQ